MGKLKGASGGHQIYTMKQNKLPPEFEVSVYRRLHADLLGMTREQLRTHYDEFGKREGRRANRVCNREDFVALISRKAEVLEIGPFTKPLVQGNNVVYADFLDQEQLIERARNLDHDVAGVPYISYVLADTLLPEIERDFDAVLSSHCIEHQPDVIDHLQGVGKLLRQRRGRYFLLVPDKRYCFDRFNSPSSIAEIIDAHYSARRVHTLKSVIEHLALTTHNDASKHWQDGRMSRPGIDSDRLRHAIEVWRASSGSYLDVHAWYFTPESFSENIGLLNSLKLIDLEIERIYPTRFGQNEFWAVLKSAIN